ncbi:MAG: glycosyltransferase [Thermoanaerobaculia bacterium]
MTDLAIVLVHYRTPELVAPAVAALVRDLASASLGGELLLVDNGSEAADQESWRGLPIRRLDAGANLGYAGGAALGIAASRAPRLVVMNPDVEVRPGCLARLVAALDDGADVAGPEFYWDRAATLRLPPTERRTPADEIVTLLGRRFATFAPRARRRWRRHAQRHWRATGPIESETLSGAMLAFRRAAWDRIGPFDDGFRLYFEETDWLLRLVRAGGRAVYEPRASAHHWYAQSSLGEPASASWFLESERRFRSRHYGAATTALLDALGPHGKAADATAPSPGSESAESGPEIDLGSPEERTPEGWLELSPLPCGYPAAAMELAGVGRHWRVPDDVWERLPAGPLWVRQIGGDGAEIGRWSLRKPV